VPGHVHDAGQFHIALGRCGDEAGPQAVTAELFRIEPGRDRVPLHDLGDAAVRYPRRYGQRKPYFGVR
jgi:hypothetical protein